MVEIAVDFEMTNKQMQKVFVFEDIICIGELLRNICVNFGFDPDTHQGYTKNINVFLYFHGHLMPWNYNPNDSIASVCDKGQYLSLKIVSI